MTTYIKPSTGHSLLPIVGTTFYTIAGAGGFLCIEISGIPAGISSYKECPNCMIGAAAKKGTCASAGFTVAAKQTKILGNEIQTIYTKPALVLLMI